MRKTINASALMHVKRIIKAADALAQESPQNDPEQYALAESRFWDSFLSAANRLYVLYDDLALRQPIIEHAETYSAIAEMNGIEAQARSGMLYVRCPHPPRRRNDYFKGYRFALNHVIGKIADQLELYPRKNIWIMNVYSPENQSAARVLDFDNYDLKNLIDEACRLYPKTDSPLNTTMHLRTIISDQIQPMTYLTITPDPFDGDVIENIVTLFESV